MRKKRYYFVVILAVLLLIAFKMQSFKSQPVEVAQVEEPTPPPYNPVIEIQNPLARFDSILDANVKASGVVGAAAVVTYKGKIALMKCYGVRKAGSNEPIDKNTIFRLASVSKSITGVLAGILDDEDIVDLDDRVIDYIPDFSLKTQKSTNELRIRHILSHTSGLIPHAYDLMVEDHVPLDKIIERLDEVDVTAAPGQLYGYQNVVYSIYDPITKAKTKKNYDALMQEKVFGPFGMHDASVGFDAFENDDNKAWPHFNKGHNRFSPMRLNDRYYNTAPAAGVNASISDLGNLLAQLTDPESKALSKHARETIFTPQVKSPLSRNYFRSWGRGIQSKQYSIGWRIVDYKGRRVAYHGGFVSGYKAEIAYCEDDEIGIAFLCNSPASETAKNIPAFLNILFEEQDRLAENKAAESAADKS
ncbi:serine hydrolase domain-containing protein [Maribellus sediminis]|uniref:serine hydrolase domain-containing protein n=1 Tax=Maribellus sediminis TaxID=2696285 RepID=UPI001431C200|nr:serine hydrolase domain-containing protein [Maribellus sediminis]